MIAIASTKLKKTLCFWMVAAVTAAFLLSSCKKEKEAVSFQPVGYWRGNAYLYHTAILNKANGKARLYFRITGTDTANAVRADGWYKVEGNLLTAQCVYNDDTLFLEMHKLSFDNMSGQLYTTFSPEIVECSLRRQ